MGLELELGLGSGLGLWGDKVMGLGLGLGLRLDVRVRVKVRVIAATAAAAFKKMQKDCEKCFFVFLNFFKFNVQFQIFKESFTPWVCSQVRGSGMKDHSRGMRITR